MDRTERQKLGIKRWIAAGGIGSLCYATGVGKTFVAIMIIKRLVKRNPNADICIVVPTEVLRAQWLEQVIRHNILTNCDVKIINTAIKQPNKYDLLIVDEAHRAASDTLRAIFEVISYDMILCLTATLERLDGKEEIIKMYAPVCDTITMQEAEVNGWVAPHKEYAVLLEVDDIAEYNEYTARFNKYFAIFAYDFSIGMKCATDWRYRNSYAKKLGMSSKELTAIAMDWNRCLRKRKEFIQSHPKKLEVCKKILEARKDKKCITFSATIKDAEAIGIGEIMHSKAKKKENQLAIERFNANSVGVLRTSKAADEGLDVKGLNVAVIMHTDSSRIRKTQRLGRVCRFEENKIAEVFTLVIKGTQEIKWLENSNTNDLIYITEEQLDKVLAGEEIETRQRNFESNIEYRF